MSTISSRPKNKTKTASRFIQKPKKDICTKISGDSSINRAKAMSLAEIMAANPILPSDIHLTPGCKASYVVVTYWWGCGNFNKNTQFPCPEDLGLNDKPSQPAILFENMIKRFGETCVKAGCHYIAKEYPQFAVPGGYQKAINAKPYFIREALNAVRAQGLKGVLYIDGDMDMKTCPLIFELSDIDVALRGWNMDPRSSSKAFNTNKICFDQSVIETSGGTMYFSTTYASYYLLNAWIQRCNDKGTAGKADDRILSELIYANKYHLSMNIIQLPIEYLWLSQSYNIYMKDDEQNALITHPLCLTGEERAADQGAAINRNTMHYENVISNNIKCKNHGGVFYEYIFFDNEKQIAEYKPYLNYIQTTQLYKHNSEYKPHLNNIKTTQLHKHKSEWIPAMYVTEWKYSFGKHTNTANTNMDYIEATNQSQSRLPKARDMYVTINDAIDTISVVDISPSKNPNVTISRIINQLLNGNHVFYHPRGVVSRNAYNDMQKFLNFPRKGSFPQFMAVNLNEDNVFKPTFDKKTPLFFAPGSPVLIKMLLMCKCISNINDIFRSSDIFWSRIRCVWMESTSDSPIIASANATVKSNSKSATNSDNRPASNRSTSKKSTL
jgi:hypothetical protein